MKNCILIPQREIESFRSQLAKRSKQEIDEFDSRYDMLVVTDEWYTKIQKAYQAGELKEVLKGGSTALEHWCQLDGNAIVEEEDVPTTDWFT